MIYKGFNDVFKDLESCVISNSYDYFYRLGMIDACEYCGKITSTGRTKLLEKLEELGKQRKITNINI